MNEMAKVAAGRFCPQVLVLLLALSVAVSAQTPDRAPAGEPAKVAAPAPESLLRVVPRSDLLATIDLRRLMTELLPAISKRNAGDLTSLTSQITSLAAAAGVDPNALQPAVVGLTLDGFQASGVIIGQGIDLNRLKIELLLKLYKLEYRVTEHRGVPLLTILTPVRPLALGPLSLKTDDLTLAPLGERRLALGNPAAVRATIDLSTGQAGSTSVSPLLVTALSETRATGLLRFSFDLPQPLREEARNQGDLFQSLAAVKVLLGDLSVSTNLDLALDATLRTGSAKEAADLTLGLRGLLNLARALFGDAASPAVKQALDSVRLTGRASDVSLSLSLPGTLIK